MNRNICWASTVQRSPRRDARSTLSSVPSSRPGQRRATVARTRNSMLLMWRRSGRSDSAATSRHPVRVTAPRRCTRRANGARKNRRLARRVTAADGRTISRPSAQVGPRSSSSPNTTRLFLRTDRDFRSPAGDSARPTRSPPSVHRPKGRDRARRGARAAVSSRAQPPRRGPRIARRISGLDKRARRKRLAGNARRKSPNNSRSLRKRQPGRQTSGCIEHKNREAFRCGINRGRGRPAGPAPTTITLYSAPGWRSGTMPRPTPASGSLGRLNTVPLGQIRIGKSSACTHSKPLDESFTL